MKKLDVNDLIIDIPKQRIDSSVFCISLPQSSEDKIEDQYVEMEMMNVVNLSLRDEIKDLKQEIVRLKAMLFHFTGKME